MSNSSHTLLPEGTVILHRELGTTDGVLSVGTAVSFASTDDDALLYVLVAGASYNAREELHGTAARTAVLDALQAPVQQPARTVAPELAHQLRGIARRAESGAGWRRSLDTLLAQVDSSLRARIQLAVGKAGSQVLSGPQRADRLREIAASLHTAP